MVNDLRRQGVEVEIADKDASTLGSRQSRRRRLHHPRRPALPHPRRHVLQPPELSRRQPAPLRRHRLDHAATCATSPSKTVTDKSLLDQPHDPDHRRCRRARRHSGNRRRTRRRKHYRQRPHAPSASKTPTSKWRPPKTTSMSMAINLRAGAFIIRNANRRQRSAPLFRTSASPPSQPPRQR